jgi:hypothetical protein
MSAVLLAVFTDFETADRARLQLIEDGFPTDRVALTSSREPGPAGVEPAPRPREKFVQYFHALFGRGEEAKQAQRLAELVVEHGAAAVTVLPRGVVETRRAIELLVHAHPQEVLEHDLDKQRFEFASASHNSPWIRSFWVEHRPGEPDCIYCRLFPGSAHETHETHSQ